MALRTNVFWKLRFFGLILSSWFIVGSLAISAPEKEADSHEHKDDGHDSHRDDHAHGDHGHHEYTVEELIDDADTMYWITMAERGSLSAIKYGFKSLKDAKKKLEKSDYSKEKKAKYKKQIDALWDDLEYQRRLAHNTHWGVFPLARFVKPTLFSDPRSSGSFEILDDPTEVAVREAVEDLVEHILEAQTLVAQYDVVFVSDPKNHELEDEALYWFNRSARFFVHNRRELAMALNDVELDELYQLRPSSETLMHVLDAFGRDDLLLCRVRKIDEAHGDYFYVAEARLFQRGDIEGSGFVKPVLVLNNYGFCIDRRDMLQPILWMHLFLFVVALVAYSLMVRFSSHVGQAPPWQNTLLMGSLGFLWGRVMMWIIAPIIGEMQPHPETLAMWSFWWPAAAGVAFVLGPAIVLNFAEHRFKFLGPAFGMFNRGGAVFATVALGSATYLVQTAMIYKGWDAVELAIPVIACSMLSAFVVGRAVDKTDAVFLGWGVAVVVLTLCFGVAWCHSKPIYLWLITVAMLGVAVGSRRQVLKKRKSVQKQVNDEPEMVDTDATEGQDLVTLAYSPPYRETKSYTQMIDALQPWFEGKTTRVALIGPAGIGKSAALRAVEDHAQATLKGVTVLRCHCSETQEGSTPEPYKPFADAIAEHFAVNVLSSNAQQMKHIDEALGGIFDSVVPFADILFPPSEHGHAGSKREMFVAFGAMVNRLAASHPVLLVLDDIHWMDEPSRELLEHLYEQFPAGESNPIALVMASRDEHDPLLDKRVVSQTHAEALSQEELQAILSHGLGLHPHIALDVLNAVGEHNDNLHWVFQIISHLAQRDLFVWRDGGYTWTDSSIQLSEHMPDDYRHSLESLVAGNSQYRKVLECAACVGPEFSIEAVSRGVGMSRLDLIHLLDEIEMETGIVKDLRHKDDRFAFRSPFMLEVLRKILEVGAHGPHDPILPQRIREYHHRLAMALEEMLDETNAVLYPVANHYFAAGSRYADKALHFALKAAKSAAAQFQHDFARKYITMAKECAKLTTVGPQELDHDLLLIELHESHVEGKDRVVMAARGLEFLNDNEDADFQIYRAVARACYDAGVDTRDQTHFANCVEVARQMLDRFDEPVHLAEAHHFCGIGLPLDQKDERRRHLKFGLSFVEDEDESNLNVLRARSRISNSLAEQLSYGSDEERTQARSLYETSIAIKSREDVRDIEGLALAHGGLGRLAFFGETPDYETAREHFAKDLKYSEKIASLTGQTKMHSLLGACELKLNASSQGAESAQSHYESAHEFAEEKVDRYFAMAGLLYCFGVLDDRKKADAIGDELVEFVKAEIKTLDESTAKEDPRSAIPTYCLASVQESLKNCDKFEDSRWYEWLSTLIDQNQTKD